MHGCICFRTTADANYSRHYSLVWPYKGSFKWELVVTLKPEVDCWSHFCFNCNLFKSPNVLISSVFTTLRNERQENKDTNLVFDLLFAFLFINGLLVELMYSVFNQFFCIDQSLHRFLARIGYIFIERRVFEDNHISIWFSNALYINCVWGNWIG